MFVEEKTQGEVRELDRVTRLLLRAAAIMEAGGHCKGRAESKGAVCLSGAITWATLEHDDGWEYWNGHEACMERIHASGLECPIEWNDAPERTKDEVVAKLRAVALEG